MNCHKLVTRNPSSSQFFFEGIKKKNWGKVAANFIPFLNSYYATFTCKLELLVIWTDLKCTDRRGFTTGICNKTVDCVHAICAPESDKQIGQHAVPVRVQLFTLLPWSTTSWGHRPPEMPFLFFCTYMMITCNSRAEKMHHPKFPRRLSMIFLRSFWAWEQKWLHHSILSCR